MNRTPSFWALLLICLCLAWATPGAALAVAPANDNFAAVSVIAGASGAAAGTNTGATAEAGEPDHYPGNTVGASVWWHYTAPANGFLMVDTVGSSFDTVLAVYTGGSVDALTGVASNDDIDLIGGVFTSRVLLEVTSGVTYHVAVDGYFLGEFYGNEQGTIALQWELSTSIANDLLADAANVTTPGATGFNTSATKETDEPDHGAHRQGSGHRYPGQHLRHHARGLQGGCLRTRFQDHHRQR